uniref:uncharacterized protein LOC122598022 isoform X2 n=1 Tax=Erigeron canadensis TaxID=72917 RepID=UPI001CB89ECF|nr:uncharacterized protein LOC122598022 isoform X2 [Erigeron canadensis]
MDVQLQPLQKEEKLRKEKKKQAGSKPVVNPVAGSSRATATGTKAMGIQGCFFKHPLEDLDEPAESLLENLIPAADSFFEIGTVASVKGGSVLIKDLDESSEVLLKSAEPYSQYMRHCFI